MPQKFFPVPNADAFVGDFAAQNLLDGSDVLVRIICRVPADFLSLNDINVVFVPAGTGNMRHDVATDFGEACNDEAYNAHSDGIVAADLAVTTDELECIGVSAGVTGVAAGDVIGVEFTRYGSHVNDTVGASVFLLGVVLDYDNEGDLVGIDIDNASRKIDLKDLTLSHIPAEVHIAQNINENNIKNIINELEQT